MLVKNILRHTITRVTGPDRKFQLVPFLRDNDIYNLAELYHENSKLTFGLEREMQRGVSLFSRPDSQDVYSKILPSFPTLNSIKLPTDFAVKEQIDKTILNRSSIRKFKKIKLSKNKLSKLLYWSCGVIRALKFKNKTANEIDDVYLRSYASGGALFPCDTYVIAINLENVSRGLYFYNTKSHSLDFIKRLEIEDIYKLITKGMLNLINVGDASALIVITSNFSRTKLKYSLRSYRFALLECGHIAQNFYLMASALKLGCVELGGFYDYEVDELLSLDGVDNSVLDVLVVGEPASQKSEPVKLSHINFNLKYGKSHGEV